MHWSDLTTPLGALLPTVVGFGLGTWNTARVQRKNDAKNSAAALHLQGQQVAQALVEFRIERNAHDKVRIGPSGQKMVLMRAALTGLSAVLASDRPTPLARLYGAVPETTRVITDWRRDTDEASLRVSAPLIKLHASVVPLIAGKNANVSDSALALWKLVEAWAPDEEVDQALTGLMAVIRAAGAPPAVPWYRPLARRAARKAIAAGPPVIES